MRGGLEIMNATLWPEINEMSGQYMFLDDYFDNRIWPRFALALFSAFSLSGCSYFGDAGLINAGTNCIGDSSECISRRQSALNTMLKDGRRAWIFDLPSGSAYLTGVRAFAYQKVQASLTCRELQHGMMEMAAAPSVLARDDPSGGDPAQLSRAKILSDSVHRDLAKRYRQNCKNG